MTMKNRTIVGLLLLCCAWSAAANAGQRATPSNTVTCDRECLRGKVTQLLAALVKHDVSGLPVHTRSAAWLSHMSTDVDLHPDTAATLLGIPAASAACRAGA